MHFSSFFFPPPSSSFFFKPLISKLQPRIHSVSAPALPAAASPSASQLNEVNKLKGLLPSPAPSVPFAAFLLHLRPRLPPPLLLPPPPHPLFSPVPAEALSSSFPHLPPKKNVFNCHCCAAKALGFPPSISQDRAAIRAQERGGPAVQTEGECRGEAGGEARG